MNKNNTLEQKNIASGEEDLSIHTIVKRATCSTKRAGKAGIEVSIGSSAGGDMDKPQWAD